MILVDTTVWIDLFAARDKPQTQTLEFLISNSEDVCICGVILTEILQGIQNERQYRKTELYFSELICLPMVYSTFVAAAEMYRRLRKKGVTIRKPIDCMIAAVAVEHEVPLLHNDRDFGAIERHCGLRIMRQLR